MSKQQFWTILALGVAASFLALTIGIVLNGVINRERAREMAQMIASATATAVAANIVIVQSEPIRLQPHPNQYATLGEAVQDTLLVPPGGGSLVEADLDGQPSTGQPVPTAVPPTVTPEPTRSAEPVIFTRYVVQQGDSLYLVAQRMNSSIELMAKHGISEAQMTPGTAIERFPYANPDYCPGRRAYVVRDRDTVFRISREFNTTPEIIRDLNNLGDDYLIKITQVICVPNN